MSDPIGNNTTDPVIHGGDVYSRKIRLDFSVNINPYAEALMKQEEGLLYKAGLSGLSMAGQYPDFYCRKLIRALAELEQLPEEQILCGNGASELFMVITHALRPKKALVLAPCYSGYEWALSSCDCETERFLLKEETGFMPQEDLLFSLAEDVDLFFLGQPNNPTGKLVEKELLDKIVHRCEEQKIRLVIDASFYPLAEAKDRKLSAYLRSPDVLLVKSFTKTMSVPGLRMGYLMASDTAVLEKIHRQLPEWNVSTVAQEVGTAAAQMLCKTDFMEHSLKQIGQERRYLTEELRILGLTVFESDTNYILAKGRPGLYDRLLAEQILIRNCSNFEGLGPEFVRFAVRTHEENLELIETIKRMDWSF